MMFIDSEDNIFKDYGEDFWKNLTNEQQLMVFCAVVRRLAKGELVDKRSYRGILYDVFDFGMESYTLALAAGFLELHNSINVEILKSEIDDGN